tara:strand:- start:15 stop:767 length:753 start_codon:yes stop_codon:yes gene_type:complete
MQKFSYPTTPFSRREIKDITRFKLIGERCSGTYYTQRLIEHNLDLPHTEEYGHKHFWTKRQENYPKDLLLVCVVREPYSWLQSFFEKKWHLPEHLHKVDFKTFLDAEIYSVKDHNLPNIAGALGSEIMADRNYQTKGRFDNIMELRHVKLNFMFHEFPKMAYNMIVLRLEDFQSDFTKPLDDISLKFDVPKKRSDYQNLEHYKGNSTLPIFKKKPLWLDQADYDLINEKLNMTWENVLNYRKIVTCPKTD